MRPSGASFPPATSTARRTDHLGTSVHSPADGRRSVVHRLPGAEPETRKADVPELSIVVPVHNEEAGLGEFHQRLARVLDALDVSSQVLYVDDGSTDRSLAVMQSFVDADTRVVTVELSRNFGKEVAVSAGLDHSRGNAVVVIDADLEDPPELIPEMVREWQGGADCVSMRRVSREGESWLKKATASVFYRLLRRIGEVPISEDVGDFRLLSRRAVDAVNACGERTRFMKGLFSWVGFRQVVLTYDRDARFTGQSKWNYWRLWNLALEGITSFSTAPLKVSSYVGLATAVCAFVFGLYVVVKALLVGEEVHGYPTLMAVILFLGGIQLMAIGVIGEYLARVFVEVKHRPLYVVASVGRQAKPLEPHRSPEAAARFEAAP